MSKKALNVHDDSRCKGIQGNTSKSEIKCVCLNARSIINKKTELNIMVDLLLNIRSPRDCGSCRSRLWYFLSPLDGPSVREAHCAQASTAVRRTEAPCAQASTAVRFSARSVLRAGYWPTCLTDGHMVLNDHTRSAENWKCVVLPSSDRWQQCVREAPLHAYSLISTRICPSPQH